jgi:hypothetical protein
MQLRRWSVLFLAVLAACGAGSSTAPQVQGGGCDSGGTRNVLFIGNSQLDVGNLPKTVESLSQSAPASCARIVATKVTMGGGNLRDLWESGRVEPAILSARYDTIVIAESIDLVEPQDDGYPAAFGDYARRMVDASRAVGARPILFATASALTPNVREQFLGMAQAQLELGGQLGVTVATGGLAWLRIWDQNPSVRLHDTDNAHPNYAGNVLSSLVVYAAILDVSPIGLIDNPVSDCIAATGCFNLPRQLAAAFQQAAWSEYLSNGRR